LLIFLPASVILGIHLYRRRQQLGSIRASLGARLGAFTGLLSFAFFFIVFALAVASHRAEYREIVAKTLRDFAAGNPDPQVQQAQQMMQSWFSGTAGMVLFTAVALGVVLASFLIIASVTGALMAAVSSNKKTL
jgi:predicted PurR-regulated permease PerM